MNFNVHGLFLLIKQKLWLFRLLTDLDEIRIKKMESSHNFRIPASSGNHGKPGKSPKKVPLHGKIMELNQNLKKKLNNHGKIIDFGKNIDETTSSQKTNFLSQIAATHTSVSDS